MNENHEVLTDDEWIYLLKMGQSSIEMGRRIERSVLAKLRQGGDPVADEEALPVAPDDEAIKEDWISASDSDGIPYDGQSFERGYRLGEIADAHRAAQQRQENKQ